MPLPFPRTIARAKIFLNVAHLEQENLSRAAAIAEAFSAARAEYFRRYPGGALPDFLAIKGARLRADYDENGALLKKNPAVRPSLKRQRIKRAARLFEDHSGHTPRTLTPVSMPEGTPFTEGFIVGRLLALELQDKTGQCYNLEYSAGERPVLAVAHDGLHAAFIDADFSILEDEIEALDSLRILRVMYETVRDGETLSYEHPFRKHARPLLQVLDGRNACTRGGAFKFTDRGFEDSR